MNRPAATPRTAIPPPNTIVTAQRPYGDGTIGMSATDAAVAAREQPSTRRTPNRLVAQPAGPSITSDMTACEPSSRPTMDGSMPPGPVAYSGNASWLTLDRKTNVARWGASTTATASAADQPSRSRGFGGAGGGRVGRVASGRQI